MVVRFNAEGQANDDGGLRHLKRKLLASHGGALRLWEWKARAGATVFPQRCDDISSKFIITVIDSVHPRSIDHVLSGLSFTAQLKPCIRPTTCLDASLHDPSTRLRSRLFQPATTMLSLRGSVVRRCLKIQSQCVRNYSVRVLGDGDPRITTISDLISTKPGDGEGLPVQVDAWIKNTRKSPALRFLDIGDGSCSAPLQAVMSTGHVQPEEYVFKLDFSVFILIDYSMQFGTAVRIKGRWRNSEASPDAQQEPASSQAASPSEQSKIDTERAPELRVEEYEVLGHSRAAVSPHTVF